MEEEEEEISLWVLEFLLRQPVDDSIIELAIANLPLPPDSSIPLSLQKSLVLRTIISALADASISETLLEYLEILEAIDADLGHPVSRSLQEAYRAVALECTIPYLHVGAAGDASYSAAVQRLWGERFQALEAKSSLITAELLQWMAPLEAALSEESARENLMRIDTRADALRLCLSCIDGAYVMLGPSFLEVAAILTAARRADPVPPPNRDSPGENREAPEVRVSSKDAAGPNVGTSCDPDQSVAADDQDERAVPSKTKQARFHRCARGGIKITDTGESGGGSLCGSYDLLPIPLVNEPQEPLKSVSLALEGAVQDPLPDAVRVAASPMAASVGTALNLESLSHHHQAREDIHAPDPSLDEGVTGAAPLLLRDCQADPCGNQNILTRCSNLMDRDKSAQTYQWDDSSEGRSDKKVQPQYHSPKVVDDSPLSIATPRRVSNRRRRKMWTSQEEETLRNGVNRFGEGHWKVIRNNYLDCFRERTEVDLKDKWRNMTR